MNNQQQPVPFEFIAGLVALYVAFMIFIYAIPFIIVGFLFSKVSPEKRLKCLFYLVAIPAGAVGYGFYTQSGGIYNGNVEGLLIGFLVMGSLTCVSFGWRGLLGIPEPQKEEIKSKNDPRVSDDDLELSGYGGYDFDEKEFNSDHERFRKKQNIEVINCDEWLSFLKSAPSQISNLMMRRLEMDRADYVEKNRELDRYMHVYPTDVARGYAKKAGEHRKKRLNDVRTALDVYVATRNDAQGEYNYFKERNSPQSRQQTTQRTEAQSAQESWALQFEHEENIAEQASFVGQFERDGFKSKTQRIIDPKLKKLWAVYNDKGSSENEKAFAMRRIKSFD